MCKEVEKNKPNSEQAKEADEKITFRFKNMQWIVLSYLLIGLLVGYLTGSSNSPVVGMVISSVFTLIGGAGGIYLLNVGVGKRESVFKLKILGMSISGFVLTCIIGIALGIASRSPLGWKALYPNTSISLQDIPTTANVKTADGIELVMLRRKLVLLGASEEEVNRLVERAGKELDGDKPNRMVRDMIADVLKTSGTIIGLLAKVDDDDPNNASFDSWTMQYYFKEIVTALTSLKVELDFGHGHEETLALSLIDKASSSITEMREEHGFLLWLDQSGVNPQTVLEIEIKLERMTAYLSPTTWKTGNAFSQELDGFIEKLLNKNQVGLAGDLFSGQPIRGLASID